MTSYEEAHRPRYHFTARKNWHNDPNGLVHYRGKWHLFFQHNPEATVWGNMTWGHAVSSDLVHWRQGEHALYPDSLGTMFSGSAVVDWEGTAGFGEQALLVFYTAAGEHVTPSQPYTQCLAFSRDGGNTWRKYEGNPVVPWIEGSNRDPKVIWHAPTARWIMALYLADDRYCLLRSADARDWERFQDLTVDGDNECPDFFPLVDQAGEERWVFWGGSGTCLVGSFDGQAFRPETGLLTCEHGRNGYAAQTWSDTPDGRRIQISWMAGGHYPEMPFNQQMSIPVALRLVGSGSDVTLARWPVDEIDVLRSNTTTVERHEMSKGEHWSPQHSGSLFDISFSLTAAAPAEITLVIRGQPLHFDFVNRVVRFRNREAPMTSEPDARSIQVRILVDRASVEIFLDGGIISASFCFLPGAYVHPLSFVAGGADATLENVVVHELRSIWSV